MSILFEGSEEAVSGLGGGQENIRYFLDKEKGGTAGNTLSLQVADLV